MTNIIGIDPGLTGAIATNHGHVFDVPLKAKGKGNSRIKQEVDDVGFYNILYYIHNNIFQCDSICYLEEQVYRPKFDKNKKQIPQGGSSILSLGDTYGICRAYQGILKMSTVKILPAQWKKQMKLPSDKEVCRAKALELFPGSYDCLKRKKDHNRAEALLLAKFGELKELGKL